MHCTLSLLNACRGVATFDVGFSPRCIKSDHHHSPLTTHQLPYLCSDLTSLIRWLIWAIGMLSSLQLTIARNEMSAALSLVHASPWDEYRADSHYSAFAFLLLSRPPAKLGTRKRTRKSEETDLRTEMLMGPITQAAHRIACL